MKTFSSHQIKTSIIMGIKATEKPEAQKGQGSKVREQFRDKAGTLKQTF